MDKLTPEASKRVSDNIALIGWVIKRSLPGVVAFLGRDKVHDIATDALINAVQRHCENRGLLSTLVSEIYDNRCRDAMRDETNRRTIAALDSDGDVDKIPSQLASPTDRAEHNDMLALIRSRWSRLSLKERLVMHYHYIEELTTREIADRLGVSSHMTIVRRIERAVRRLRCKD